MTVEWKSSQAMIGHLKLHNCTTDMNVPALRLRTERLLNNVDLPPRDLPPGSLLLVQKIYVSTPLSSSTSTQSRWAEQLHAQIETLYRTAARAALGPIPMNATSVFFADTAEMLACLTLDLLKGRAWQRWYWQGVLRRVPRVPEVPGSIIAALWSEHAAFVPAMLSYIREEELQAAIALLSLPEASRVIAALNAGFALPSPSSTTPQAIASDRLPLEASRLHHGGSPSEAPGLGQSFAISLPFGPPWQRWLASSQLTSLSPQAQYLLGLIVTLHHAPSFARSPEYMARALSWLRAEQEREAAVEERIAANQQQQDSFSPAQAAVTNRPAHPTSDPAGSPARDVIFGPSQPFPSEGLLTALGGILYLVNVLRWLNLPADGAVSGTLSEYLGGWAIVELLARGLLGALVEEYAADPIWSVLAKLDNREPGEFLGAHLPQQGAFRLPAAWSARYSMLPLSLLAAIDGKRLYLVERGARYLVGDVPLAGRSAHEVIAAEIAAYRAQDIDVTIELSHDLFLENNLHPSLSNLVHPNARWWLERVIGFVRFLLVRALHEPAIDEHSLAESLLCKRGRLIAGRTHVDLYMPMDQVSLPIRCAGLDRDPGWVPDLGRIVLFHFGQEM